MFHLRPASALFFTITLITSRGAVLPAATAPALPGYTLTFSDEFNSTTADAPVDPAKWTFDTGGDGFGNHELEYYTTRTANARQSNGNLVITALKESFTGPDGVKRNYTSARLKTQGLFSQKYGRFEARIKLPLGKGIWPAFWMLGDNISTAGWPKCGEIDILENIGSPTRIYTTLHGPKAPGPPNAPDSSDQWSPQSIFDFPAPEAVDTAFHTYTLDWTPAQMSYSIDGHNYGKALRADAPPGSWVFDQPFFILLNVAVGGDWPGSPGASTTFPQQMLVDYVRVYKKD